VRTQRAKSDSNDLGIALVELLAEAGEVLAEAQDELADEAYLTTDWDGAARRLRIRLDRSARPLLCLIADRSRVYAVVVGKDTGARLVFGDGASGKRPPASRKVTARYRRGAGGAGNLTVGGIHLEEPFVVLAAAGPRVYAASESGGCSSRARKTGRGERR